MDQIFAKEEWIPSSSRNDSLVELETQTIILFFTQKKLKDHRYA